MPPSAHRNIFSKNKKKTILTFFFCFFLNKALEDDDNEDYVDDNNNGENSVNLSQNDRISDLFRNYVLILILIRFQNKIKNIIYT